MKAGWEIKTLGEVATFSQGIQVGLEKQETKPKDGFVRFIRIIDYTQNTDDIRYVSNPGEKYFVNEDDIVMVRYGTPGLIGRGKAGVIANNLFKIKIECADLTNDYLTLFLSQDKIQNYLSTQGSATMPALNFGQLKTVEIKFPPLPEQKRLVTLLDEAFESIATAKANAQQNLKNARALFESHLQDIFENPKDNWQKKKWSDLCDFVRGPFGGSLKKSIFKESGYAVYEQKHAIHDHFNQLRYFIDEDKFNEMIRFELKPNDIIMSCSGVTLGRVAIVPENIPRGIINQALLKLTPKKGVSVHFLKHWLRSRIFQKIIFDFAGGAAIPNVPSAKILKDILIPLPSIEEQMLVVTKIEDMQKETQRLEALYSRKIAALDELKKALLHRAFSGEL